MAPVTKISCVKNWKNIESLNCSTYNIHSAIKCVVLWWKSYVSSFIMGVGEWIVQSGKKGRCVKNWKNIESLNCSTYNIHSAIKCVVLWWKSYVSSFIMGVGEWIVQSGKKGRCVKNWKNIESLNCSTYNIHSSGD